MKSLILICSLIFSFKTFSHPVIYKDGWVYQGTFTPSMNEIRMGYSVTSRFALVGNGNYFKNNENYQDYTLGLNFLVKRWLGQDSQGNLYLGAHGGYFENDRTEGDVYHSLFMADWESRQNYIVAKSKGYFFDDKEEFDYMFRYGFAPFVAGMNELQTWLILQAYYYKEVSRNAVITPMIRFFYNNVLWETGFSTRGQAFLTLMVHY